jgi:peptidoglycan hydrolase-like protein with peptidoglycan-binding domain
MKKTLITLGMLSMTLALIGSTLLPTLASADNATSTAVEASMIGQLHRGSSGNSVKLLQALLAADSSVYPQGVISGYYGALTAAAVARFQKKHGLAAVGTVGPKTLLKISDEIASTSLGIETNGSSTVPCAMVPPGHLIAPGWLKHNGGVVPTVPTVPTCQILPPGILMKLTGTTTTSTSTPPVDVTAPVISGITENGITSTGAIIGWNTNEGATSQVEYGTSTSYTNTTALDSTLLSTHAVTLSGLSATTTYHFRIDTKDSSGNLATSSDMTFMTLATPDTTAPVISSVSVSGLASTSASIMWTTNELSTSKVYFGTVNPLNLTTAANVSSSTLATAHSLMLSGLATSTTYFYVVQSADASSNTATTTQSSFTTLAL